MITFTRNDIQRVTVSALGALLVSSACIGAAVFPAKAAEVTTSTASAWQTEVNKRIDKEMRSPLARSEKVVMATVAVRFDDHGAFRSAGLAKSSGIAAVDQEAVRVANTISYPLLPTYLQGRTQQVGMQILFGNSAEQVRRENAKANDAATALAAKADAAREQQAQIAAQPTS